MGGGRPRRRTEPKIGDDAARARTGKAWGEWFRILDAAGARNMEHGEIVRWLRGRHRLGSWWEQQVTVAYEQARGLRDVHEKPAGYEIGCSRTIGVPVRTAFRAWSDAVRRERWLDDPGVAVRRVTPDRSMRMTWGDGTTRVEVTFRPAGDGRCRVQVQHGKLKDAAAAARVKRYWARNLDRLREALEATGGAVKRSNRR